MNDIPWHNVCRSFWGRFLRKKPEASPSKCLRLPWSKGFTSVCLTNQWMSLWTVRSKGDRISGLFFTPKKISQKEGSLFFLNTFKFRMWRSIPASFWLSVKTQVAFQGCIFGRVCQTCFRLLHETDIGCTTKKSPFFAQRLCLEFRTTSKTAIPKLSNAHFWSTRSFRWKNLEFLSASLPHTGQRLHTLRKTQILQCFFCPAKKKIGTHTCFAACLMIHLFWQRSVWRCEWMPMGTEGDPELLDT